MGITHQRDGYGRHFIYDDYLGTPLITVRPVGNVEIHLPGNGGLLGKAWLPVLIDALQLANKIADRPEPWQPYAEEPEAILYQVSFQTVDAHYAASVETLEGRGVWAHLWDRLTWHTVSHETDDPWDQVQALHNWEQTREQPIRNVAVLQRIGTPTWKPLRLTCPRCEVYLYPARDDGKPIAPVHRCANCGQSC